MHWIINACLQKPVQIELQKSDPANTSLCFTSMSGYQLLSPCFPRPPLCFDSSSFCMAYEVVVGAIALVVMAVVAASLSSGHFPLVTGDECFL